MAVERDENGRLLPGSVLNPAGSPPRTRVADIYQMLLQIFDDNTRQAFIDAQQRRLAKGDNSSWRELSKYLLPTVSRTEHTGADGEPLLRMSDIIAALQAMEEERKRQAGQAKPPTE